MTNAKVAPPRADIPNRRFEVLALVEAGYADRDAGLGGLPGLISWEMAKMTVAKTRGEGRFKLGLQHVV